MHAIGCNGLIAGPDGYLIIYFNGYDDFEVKI